MPYFGKRFYKITQKGLYKVKEKHALFSSNELNLVHE
jgi:hypothetical protein